MKANALSGIRVLVTRPVHQAGLLCDMISNQGGQAVRLPVLEIEALPVSEKLLNIRAALNNIDFMIFISPNAVEYGVPVLLAHNEIPDKLKLATIGRASAKKLQQVTGRVPDLCPTGQYNSEALLALEELQHKQVIHRRVLIVRGRGGRELLADTLRQRGARVNYAEVYQRKNPAPEQLIFDDVWHTEAPDIITVTSDEGLNNLVAMHPKPYLPQLRQTPLVVVTEKMRQNAKELGFNNAIIVAKKAGNDDLLKSVQAWAHAHKSSSSAGLG